MVNLHPSLTEKDSMSNPDRSSILSIEPPFVSSINPSEASQKSSSYRIQDASGNFVKLSSQRLFAFVRGFDESEINKKNKSVLLII